MNKKTNLKPWFREHRTGLLWTGLLAAGSGAIVYYVWPCLGQRECQGGDVLGVFFGASGLFAIAASVAYSLRRHWLNLMIVNLEQWLYGHVVVGGLSLLLVIAHSGFHLQNQVAVLALLFLAVTVFSGMAGLFIFYFLPRSLARHEAVVLVPVDLCQRLSRLHEELSELCSEKGGVFLEVYNERVVPLYRTEAGQQHVPSADVNPWADQVTGEDREPFMNLAVKVEEVHDLLVLLGRNMRFRWWIRGWLLVHIPATIGLVVFTVAHLLSVSWYGGPP